MGLPAAELALFTVADLDVFGLMPEALSDLGVNGPAIKAAMIAAAIGEVLSWLPNVKRPILEIGEDLKDDIGVLAVSKLVTRFRGIGGVDLELIQSALEQTMARRELIIQTGNASALRPWFRDSTPDVDDFATIGGGSLSADAWAQP